MVGVSGEVVHRYVWDQVRRGRTGVHLRSANLDGTDVRRVYDSRRGFTLDLSLDPSGHWVAFEPCCRDRFPTMVVANTDGDQVLTPLDDHPRIGAVGGIGWSPNGNRIAFEGTVFTPNGSRTYLWSVRPDGTQLRRLMQVPYHRHTCINDALGWTSEGILYSNCRNLRILSNGESRLVLRRVTRFRLSGDGSTLVTLRYREDGSAAWVSKPDGTEGRRILTQGYVPDDVVHAPVIPNFDGSALLAERWTPSDNGAYSEVVTWQTSADPQSATVVVLDGLGYVFTWN
jgi:hypothetical protein